MCFLLLLLPPVLCRYALTLTPNLDTYKFAGNVQIEMNVNASKINTDNASKVTLHAKELAFVAAEYKVLEVSPAKDSNSDSIDNAVVKATEINANLKETTVDFVFEKGVPLDASKVLVSIEFVGFLNNQMAGFYRSSYTDIEGNTRIMGSTQFESLDARRAFPCVDEPAAKAVFQLTMIIPSHLQCLSNMPESSVVSIDKTTKKISYLDTPLMSTYLLAFCVGEFDYVQAKTSHGVLVRVLTPPGHSDKGQFALDVACQSLDAYNDFFDLPYPLPKLDMVAIPEFAAGAMESTYYLFF